MRAIVSSPTSGVYVARFYYTTFVTVDTGANGPQICERLDYTKPLIEIPCTNLEHARRVVAAYNWE